MIHMSNTTNTNQFTFNLTIPLDHNGFAIKFEAETEWFDTKEQAEEILARLPKSVGAKVRECAFSQGSYPKKVWVDRWCVGVYASLTSEKDNEKNETGLKRLDALMKNANINYIKKYANSPETLEMALASL